MRCSLVTEDFKNPYASVKAGVRTVRNGVVSIQNSDQFSVLYAELYNLYKTTEEGVDRVAARKAYDLYKTIESEEFLDWFKESDSGHNVNSQGEPKLLGNKHYNSKVNGEESFWHVSDSNKATALERIPLGLKRIPGMSAAQILEATERLFAEILKNNTYTVQDFTDLKHINFDILAKAVTFGKFYLPEKVKAAGGVYPADMQDMWDRMFRDLIYHDPTTGTPAKNSEGSYFLDKHNSKLLELVVRRVSSASGVKAVEDNEPTAALNITPAHFTNPKESAAANIKLLIQSLWKTEWADVGGKTVVRVVKSPTLKSSTLVNATKVYAQLQSYLAGVHPIAGELDVLPAMITKLETLLPYHAEYSELLRILRDPATPAYKKTQFVQAFYRPSIDFSTTFVEKESRYSTIIGSPDVQSSEKDILNMWQVSFEKKLLTVSDAGRKVLDLKAAQGALDKYNKLTKDIGYARRNDFPLTRFNGQILDLLKSIGVDMSSAALKYHILNTSTEEDPTIGYAMLMSGMNYVFQKSKAKGSTTVANMIESALAAQKTNSNKPVLEDEEGDVRSIITDESGINTLALAEAVFKEDLVDNTVLGPGGKLYWKYGLYSFLHTTIDKLHRGDTSYLDKLEAYPYTANSRWVRWLRSEVTVKGKLNRENFKLVQFLHMVNTSTDSQGKAYTELLGPDHMVNAITRSLKGLHGTIARGTASTDYAIQGPPVENSGVIFEDSQLSFENSNVLDIFKEYIESDIIAQRQAFEDVKNASVTGDMSKMVLFYHYHLDKNNNAVFFDKNGVPAGNVFKGDTMVFPELGYNANEKGEATGLAAELGIYGQHGETRGMPFTIDESASVLNDPRVETLIEESFRRIFYHNLQKAEKLEVMESVGGYIINKRVEKTLLDNTYEDLENTHKPARALGDYVLNSMIATRESISLFVGHPAMYKSVEDMPKRTGHFTTPVSKLRIYKDASDNWEVHPNYLHATVTDIEAPSMVSQDPRFRELVGDEIADLWEGETDIADATTWVSPTLFKQREKGVGKWNDIRDAAFNRIMKGNGTKADFENAMFTPVKGTVRGMVSKGFYIIPKIEKTAYMPLWPALVNTTSLQEVYDTLLKKEAEYKEEYGEEIGAQIGLISSTKIGANTVGKIDDGAGNISMGDLTFTSESHDNWGLAQDLPTKGFKPTIVGSQAKVNIMANIDPEGMYGELTGEAWLEETHEVERQISDLGLEEFAADFGIEITRDEDGVPTGVIKDRTLFKQALSAKFLEADNMNIVEGLESNEVPLDAIFQARSRFQSIITNGLKSKAVLYKSLGGSFAQMSAFGLGIDENRYGNLSDSVRNKIRWIVPSNRLKPPRLDMENKKVLPGQILLPYKFVKDIKGYENMSDEELRAAIDPKALQVIGYRIPNQSVASMDSLEIVGILPEELGDTIVVYEDITAKTGSDFDIDKVFLLLPNLRIDGPAHGNTGKLVRVPSSEEGKKSLENRRIELWEDALQSKDNMAQVMYPTDASFLKDDANAIRKMIEKDNPETDGKGKDIMLGLKMLSPDFQESLRERFIIGQKMVAAVANNIVDQVNSTQSGFYLNSDIGIGHRFNLGTKEEPLWRTSLHETQSENESHFITQLLSAYMNANVDIEKDPYIYYTNFNPNTSNVGFLLLRAGVDYRWVNRFLAQPVLRSLSDQMDFLGSESLPGGKGFRTAVTRTKSKFFPSTAVVRPRRTYSGFVTELKDNQVFVFGSNPEGRHGAGAAKAALAFGAVYGEGVGMHGQTYAIPTKDLRVTENNGMRSISEDDIADSIEELYTVARENPTKEFLINDYTGNNLNGYSGEEMAEMFSIYQSNEIPPNIVFSEGFEKLVNEVSDIHGSLGTPVEEETERKQVEVSSLKDGDIVYTQRGEKFIFRGLRAEGQLGAGGLRLEETTSPNEIEIAGAHTPLFTSKKESSSSTKEESKEEVRLEDKLTIKILDRLLSDSSSRDYFEMQDYILEKFQELKDEADPVFSQLLATKVSTKAAGKSLIEAAVMREKKVEADNSTVFEGFTNKFTGTTLEAQYKNSIDFLLNTFEGEFLSNSPFMENGLNAILGVTGNTGSQDVEMRTRIVNKMYSYIYSGFFSRGADTDAVSKGLLFNSTENAAFVREFRVMQENRPSSILLGLLGSKLNHNAQGEFKNPSYITARGTKSVPADVMNLAYREWEEMYLNKDTAKFASKLVRMAFASSGFGDSLASFHKMIPMQWVIDSGFAQYIEDTTDLLQESGSGIYLQEMVSQILRHEFENKSFVEDFSDTDGVWNVYRGEAENKIIGLNKGKKLTLPRALAVELKFPAVKKAISKKIMGENGKPPVVIYKKFIRYDVQGATETVATGAIGKNGKPIFSSKQGETIPTLYELAGEDKTSGNPIYVSRDPLGYRGKGGVKLNEFTFNPSSVANAKGGSIYDANKSGYRLLSAKEEGHAARLKEFLTTLRQPLHYSQVVRLTAPHINKC